MGFGRLMKSALVLMFLAVVVVQLQQPEARRMKETNMVFYLQDWESGYNVSSYRLAGLHPRDSVLNFSALYVIDDPVTVALNRNSTEIGRAQGIYVNSALDGSSLHMLLSVIFTKTKYKGSTIEIQGADRALLLQREISVVSGTGHFRYARGYAVLETTFVDVVGLNAVLKFNVSILHF